MTHIFYSMKGGCTFTLAQIQTCCNLLEEYTDARLTNNPDYFIPMGNITNGTATKKELDAFCGFIKEYHNNPFINSLCDMMMLLTKGMEPKEYLVDYLTWQDFERKTGIEP